MRGGVILAGALCCLLSQQALSESYQFKQVVRGLSSTDSSAIPSQAEREKAWLDYAKSQNQSLPIDWNDVTFRYTTDPLPEIPYPLENPSGSVVFMDARGRC